MNLPNVSILPFTLTFAAMVGRVRSCARPEGPRRRIGVLRVPKKKKRLIFRSAAPSESRRDYFASFFGLHFSHVLPSFLASTQHLCVHSLPAAFAFSQQVSARTLTAPRIARAH